ncbi:hypothetical protein [Nocardia sp. NPDC052566]
MIRGLLAGYARRLVPQRWQGRALAVVLLLWIRALVPDLPRSARR